MIIIREILRNICEGQMNNIFIHSMNTLFFIDQNLKTTSFESSRLTDIIVICKYY